MYILCHFHVRWQVSEMISVPNTAWNRYQSYIDETKCCRHDRLGHVQGHHERMAHTKKTQQYKKRAEQDETNISHELCANIALSSFIIKL